MKPDLLLFVRAVKAASIVFTDGATNWLADGFHRFHAHRKLELPTIEAEVKQGSLRDAILYSVGANAQHGKRRTNADKRKAVMTMLNDEEWSKWSDREIARRCAVGNKMVSETRNSICVKDTDKPTERKVERNGTVYTQNTANIGKSYEIDYTRTAILHKIKNYTSPLQY